MDERTAAQLSEWAEREMTLTPNSAGALRGAMAAKFGRATLDELHVPAQADPDIGAVLERVRLAIADERDDDGREASSGPAPWPGAAETS